MTSALIAFAIGLTVLLSAPPFIRAGDLVRGPYLQSCTQTSMVVRWRTDGEEFGIVRFGTNAVLNRSATEPDATTDHAVLVSGLSPDTRYFYSVGNEGSTLASGPDYFFITAPSRPKPTRIWAIGDSGTGPGMAYLVRDAYLDFTGNRHTDVWLMLGDNAYDEGTDEQYQFAVFETYPQLLRQTCLWPTIGNHDAASGPRGYVYADIFSLPPDGGAGGVPSGTEYYYSYDYSDIHFVVLDSVFSSRALGDAMLTWLEEDLAANTKLWTIVYFHYPPYSKGTHDSDIDGLLTEFRQNALPILEAHNVDLVLTGHSHVYERSFLLNGHYGFSQSFSATMKVDGGSGRTNESGAYQKSAATNATVYAVVGCSGQVGSGSLNHPANFVSIGGVGGSLVIDVAGNRLDATFLRYDGGIDDTFTILKEFDAPALTVRRTGSNVTVSWPTPTLSYKLEATGDLTPPIAWSGVTNAISEQNSRKVVVVPNDAAYRYFRLRR